jgi:1-pyrroline-5-carboxylate dehydrogenase
MIENYKLTYASMYDPPEELHTRFEKALVDVQTNLGKQYGMIIDGQEQYSYRRRCLFQSLR